MLLYRWPLLAEVRSEDGSKDTMSSPDSTPPPSKKAKTTAAKGKSKKYQCQYKPEYAKEFPWARKTTKKGHAFCQLCNTSFNIEHGGKNDLSKHTKTDRHVEAVRAAWQTPSMGNFVTKSGGEATKVVNAEEDA